jgi:hypothetical protein
MKDCDWTQTYCEYYGSLSLVTEEEAKKIKAAMLKKEPEVYLKNI